jgi:hypothetical protein
MWSAFFLKRKIAAWLIFIKFYTYKIHKNRSVVPGWHAYTVGDYNRGRTIRRNDMRTERFQWWRNRLLGPIVTVVVTTFWNHSRHLYYRHKQRTRWLFFCGLPCIYTRELQTIEIPTEVVDTEKLFFPVPLLLHIIKVPVYKEQHSKLQYRQNCQIAGNKFSPLHLTCSPSVSMTTAIQEMTQLLRR